MEALKLKPGQEVELDVDGNELRLKPVKTRRIHRIEHLVAEMRRLGPDHEPPYEDWRAGEAPWPDTPRKVS